MSNQQSEVRKQLVLFEDKKETHISLLTSDILKNLWHQSFIVEGYESRTEANKARQKGEELMKHFFEWWQKEKRTVAAIEKGFTAQTGSTSLSGRYDRVEYTKKGVHIIDYKTGSPRSQQEVDADLQLSVYALAAKESFNMPCAKLTLLFLQEDLLIEKITERSEAQLEDAKQHICSLNEHIQKQDFHPTPSANVCQHCPYNSICDVASV